MEKMRDEVMQFRVTTREKELIEKWAKKSDTTVSNYVRASVLMEMIIDGEPEALRIVMTTLGRKGIEALKRKLHLAEGATGGA